MPCSNCGGIGHNRRTCPQIHQNQQPQNIEEPKPPEPPEDPKPSVDDNYITMIQCENEIRNLVIRDEINTLSEEELKFFETFLGIRKIECRFINLETNKFVEIYLINGNKMVEDLNQKKYSLTYIGEIKPRTIIPLTTFTGYDYILIDKTVIRKSKSKYPSKTISEIIQEQYYTMPGFLKIEEKITQLISIASIYDTMNQTILIEYPEETVWKNTERPLLNCISSKNKNLFSLLKMNYLIQQMIRLGGLENENFSPILELHTEIQLPNYDTIDLEAAGLPSELTNII